jgi:hypothetical protein
MKTPRLTALLHAALLAGALAPAVAADRLTAELEPMLGADAAVVVAGLRDGTPIALPAAAGSGGKVVIESPIGPMGEVNVERTLRVARGELAGHGIQRPTAEQLRAALTGGEIQTAAGQRARLDGVLTLRQQNLGWGEIARRAGVSMETLLRDDPLYGH